MDIWYTDVTTVDPGIKDVQTANTTSFQTDMDTILTHTFEIMNGNIMDENIFICTVSNQLLMFYH